MLVHQQCLAAAVSVLHTAGLEDEHLLPVINDNSANHKLTPASLAQSIYILLRNKATDVFKTAMCPGFAHLYFAVYNNSRHRNYCQQAGVKGAQCRFPHNSVGGSKGTTIPKVCYRPLLRR